MLDALTLDQLRVFVAVAEAGSFRAAAKQLSRVQSAVSFAVANLEAQLGLSLSDRTGARARLTADGEALLEDARALLLKARVLRARATGLGQGVEISLCVAVDPFFPPDRLVRALVAVHAAFPTVAVRLVSRALGGPLAAVRSGEAALGVTLSDELRDPTVELEAIGAVELVAVAAPSHPLAVASREQPLSAAALADHAQVVVEDPSPATEGRSFGVLSPLTWRVTDLQTKLDLLRAGVGWGSVPAHMASPLLSAGELAVLRPAELGEGGTTRVPAYLARRLDMALGPAAGLLRQALVPP